MGDWREKVWDEFEERMSAAETGLPSERMEELCAAVRLLAVLIRDHQVIASLDTRL